jgi:hypothetical protein
MILNPELSKEQSENLGPLRKQVEQLIEDCFKIERECSNIELPQLRQEFYRARCAIADAQHQLLRQMGWRK